VEFSGSDKNTIPQSVLQAMKTKKEIMKIISLLEALVRKPGNT
jgi:hypothetical protein